MPYLARGDRELNSQSSDSLTGHVSESPKGLVKTQIADSIHLGWTPRIRILNKFPGNTDAAGLRTTF